MQADMDAVKTNECATACPNPESDPGERIRFSAHRLGCCQAEEARLRAFKRQLESDLQAAHDAVRDVMTRLITCSISLAETEHAVAHACKENWEAVSAARETV